MLYDSQWDFFFHLEIKWLNVSVGLLDIFLIHVFCAVRHEPRSHAYKAPVEPYLCPQAFLYDCLFGPALAMLRAHSWHGAPE